MLSLKKATKYFLSPNIIILLSSHPPHMLHVFVHDLRALVIKKQFSCSSPVPNMKM